MPTENEEIDMAGVITLDLSGSGHTEDNNTQDLYILFAAPKLDNMRGKLPTLLSINRILYCEVYSLKINKSDFI